MFTRYNINDLFLAYVIVTVYKNGSRSYEFYYPTILKKVESGYIDLQHPNRTIDNGEMQDNRIYTTYEIEPLSKHYTQDGRRKNTFTKKNALKIGEQYIYVVSNKICERAKSI